jgi:hypothetical protein
MLLLPLVYDSTEAESGHVFLSQMRGATAWSSSYMTELGFGGVRKN